MFSKGLLIGTRPFQDGIMSGKNALFRAHCQKVPNTHNSPAKQRKQDELFPYLALQFEVLVILLQEAHSTNAEKLVLPSFQLAWSFLSRKHGLATFVHERITYNKQGML